jgi:hypothetical protein
MQPQKSIPNKNWKAEIINAFEQLFDKLKKIMKKNF